jgi:hypothetical protein
MKWNVRGKKQRWSVRGATPECVDAEENHEMLGQYCRCPKP